MGQGQLKDAKNAEEVQRQVLTALMKKSKGATLKGQPPSSFNGILRKIASESTSQEWSTCQAAVEAYALIVALHRGQDSQCKIVIGKVCSRDPESMHVCWISYKSKMYWPWTGEEFEPPNSPSLPSSFSTGSYEPDFAPQFMCDEWSQVVPGHVSNFNDQVVVYAKGHAAQSLVQNAACFDDEISQLLGDKSNFYELFELPKYSDMTEEHKTTLNKTRKKLLLKWHPDKRPASMKEKCELVVVRVALGQQVLLSPDLKRRYDDELRKLDGSYSNWKWYCRWGWAVVASLGGLKMIIAGITLSPITGGGSFALSVGGSALLNSGINCSVKMWKDPNCSDAEMIKDCAVGLLTGAATGAVGAGVGLGVKALKAPLVQVALAAFGGAGSVAVGFCIKDACDLFITEGLANTDIRNYITDCKTKAGVFSKDNAKALMMGCFLGAVVGGAAEFIGGGAGAGLVDDFAYQGARLGTKLGWDRMLMQGAARVRELADSVRVQHHFRALGDDLDNIADMQEAFPTMLRDIFATIRPNATDEEWLRDFFHSRDIRNFRDAMPWIATNITWTEEYLGEFLSAREVVERRAGVCMEFATLSKTLSLVLDGENCKTKVFIGLMSAADPESCHAWIEYDGEEYEPQSGKPTWHTKGMDNRRGKEITYEPVYFTYSEWECEIVDRDAYNKWQHIGDTVLTSNMDQFLASGIGCNMQNDQFGIHNFVGLWEDKHRGFRVKADGTVVPEWSRIRNVDEFECTPAVYCNTSSSLQFTLKFPPDQSNPFGCAHWKLHPSGKATISFDGALESLKGKRSHEQPITFRKPMVGVWMDDIRVIRICEDYSVIFLKAQRDIKDLDVREIGKWDDDACIFSFTVHFPPDKSNPNGKATWHLHESGEVEITFDEDVPEFGKAMPLSHMYFEPVVLAL